MTLSALPSFRLILAGMFTLLAANVAFAEVKLPGCFGDKMVLQRELPVAIWGTAAPGEKLSVSFRSQQKHAVADDKGAWRINLDPLTGGGPDDLTVAGTNTITFKDVLVGEVWFGSGQSNMALNARAPDFKQDTLLAERIEGTYPKIRFLTSGGTWVEANPQTIPKFSALLFSFGYRLQQELDVPVGLICGAVGGTPSCRWLNPEMIFADDVCKTQIEEFKTKNTPEVLQAEFDKQIANWQKQVDAATAKNGNPPPRPEPIVPGDFTGRNFRGVPFPGDLYRQHIEPYAGYTIRSFFWDQGESGTGLPELDQFATMRALIGGWRKVWDQGEIPFLYNAKPSGSGCAWDYENPVTRLARPFAPLDMASRVVLSPGPFPPYLRMRELPSAHMVWTSDLGDGGHPANKSGYGARAADVALNRIYGRTSLPSAGPTYASHTVEDGAVRIRFDNVGKGLAYRHGERLQGFAITDATRRKIIWADARIDGDTVVVSTENMPNPGALFYAWHSVHPWANLFSKDGLPAVPFQIEDVSAVKK